MFSTILLLFSFFSINYCWGPVSHYWFLSTVFCSVPEMCLTDPNMLVYLQGASLPDGLAGFVSEAFQYGSKCRPGDIGIALHDLEFAGYMYKQAYLTSDQTLRNFTVGYASHMISDLVGFFPTGGYLSNGTLTKRGLINWITMWPKMASIDSYYMNNLKNQYTKLPNIPISSDIASFISNSTVAYSKIHSNFPVYTSQEIQECSNEWSSMINRLYDYYYNVLTIDFVQNQLIYFDQLSATNWNSTEQFLLKNQFCITQSIYFWWNAISISTPEDAMKKTIGFITDQYQNGLCN